MMNRLSIPGFVVCCAIVAGLGGPAFAADKPRVVLLTLPGKGDALQAPLHKAVGGELESQAEVIGFKEFSSVAAQLNLSGRAMFSSRGLKAVVKELRADYAVLVRAVRRTRGQEPFFKLILVVLNVATGKRKGAGSVTLEGQTLTARGVEAIVDALRPHLGQVAEKEEEFVDLEEVAPEEPPKRLEPTRPGDKPRVVLLTLPGKGAALQDPLHKAVGGALESQAEVIGIKEFSSVAAQLNLSWRAMFSSRGLTAVVKELRADYAVLVKAARRARGNEPFFQLSLVVLNVATGKRKRAGSVSLEGQTLTARGVEAIVDALRPHLGQAAEKEEEFVDLEEVAPEKPARRAEPAKRVEALKADASAPEWDGVSRVALRLHFGAGVFQRFGIVRSEGQADDYITCYCADAGSPNSVIGGVNIMGEFYPLELTRWNTWTRRLGLQMDAVLGSTTTRVEDEQFESRIVSGMGGLVMRVPLDLEEGQGDFQVRAGYGYFTFPLKNFPFPGVIYSGPYLGGTVNYPVTETAVLKAGAYMNAPLSAGGGTRRLGTSFLTGNGYRLEAGARVLVEQSRYASYEMIFLGRVDGYKTAYEGVTALNLDIQAVNAKLVDRVFTFLWTVGVAL